MNNSIASVKTEDTLVSISETVETNHNKSEKKEEEEDEKENTDCRVYTATCLLLLLCVFVIFAKVFSICTKYLGPFMKSKILFNQLSCIKYLNQRKLVFCI